MKGLNVKPNPDAREFFCDTCKPIWDEATKGFALWHRALLHQYIDRHLGMVRTIDGQVEKRRAWIAERRAVAAPWDEAEGRKLDLYEQEANQLHEYAQAMLTELSLQGIDTTAPEAGGPDHNDG